MQIEPTYVGSTGEPKLSPPFVAAAVDDSCQVGWLPCARGGRRAQVFACGLSIPFLADACVRGSQIVVLSKIRPTSPLKMYGVLNEAAQKRINNDMP